MVQDRLIEHKQYIDRYGQDMPEIRNWKWKWSTPNERAREYQKLDGGFLTALPIIETKAPDISAYNFDQLDFHHDKIIFMLSNY